MKLLMPSLMVCSHLAPVKYRESENKALIDVYGSP